MHTWLFSPHRKHYKDTQKHRNGNAAKNIFKNFSVCNSLQNSKSEEKVSIG